MNTSTYAIILDPEDTRGLVDSQAVQRGDPTLWVTLEDGERLLIPASLLSNNDHAPFHIEHRWADLLASHKTPTAAHPGADGTIPPGVEEAIPLDNYWDESGYMRIRKLSREEEALVQASVLRQEMNVERVPKNETLSEMPTVRYEGDTLVIPVVEEVVVVEKRFVLKEEIRVNKHLIETPWEQVVLLHKEKVVIEPGELDVDEVAISPD